VCVCVCVCAVRGGETHGSPIRFCLFDGGAGRRRGGTYQKQLDDTSESRGSSSSDAPGVCLPSFSRFSSFITSLLFPISRARAGDVCGKKHRYTSQSSSVLLSLHPPPPPLGPINPSNTYLQSYVRELFVVHHNLNKPVTRDPFIHLYCPKNKKSQEPPAWKVFEEQRRQRRARPGGAARSPTVRRGGLVQERSLVAMTNRCRALDSSEEESSASFIQPASHPFNTHTRYLSQSYMYIYININIYIYKYI